MFLYLLPLDGMTNQGQQINEDSHQRLQIQTRPTKRFHITGVHPQELSSPQPEPVNRMSIQFLSGNQVQDPLNSNHLRSIGGRRLPIICESAFRFQYYIPSSSKLIAPPPITTENASGVSASSHGHLDTHLSANRGASQTRTQEFRSETSSRTEFDRPHQVLPPSDERNGCV